MQKGVEIHRRQINIDFFDYGYGSKVSNLEGSIFIVSIVAKFMC